MAKPTPTQEELDDILLSARFGEVDEIKAFGEQYGWDALAGARDERGNSTLHMACGNGHLDVLQVLLEHLPAAALQATNEAGSPPIHWAVLNNHVACVSALVDVPEARGGGIQLLHQKNAADRDAFAEAIFAGEGKEEVAGWIEGFLWKAEGGDDNPNIKVTETEDGEVKMTVGEAEGSDDKPIDSVKDITAKAENLEVADKQEA
ncbi:uncharacterized protein EHS24_002102 [Apiotrichum porosum]|uniref:Uncharacterized protein n=1 Tax=Apiotrichum porosum TaxID=105984 RepID=A0A427XI11_9TREE|nr:uncharacterized protein EHS24_002102 [Apiotrichum porosum]RSH78377.1 hypothetical protein EHS24_002102 [Apiotrichum porosum]